MKDLTPEGVVGLGFVKYPQYRWVSQWLPAQDVFVVRATLEIHAQQAITGLQITQANDPLALAFAVIDGMAATLAAKVVK